MKEFPLMSVLNIHENLIEAVLEMQGYSEVQVLSSDWAAMRECPFGFMEFLPLQAWHYICRKYCIGPWVH